MSPRPRTSWPDGEGDCFVALGVGPGPDASAVEREVEQDVAERGIALGKRPVEVRAGVVTVPAEEASLERLVNGVVGALPAGPERDSAD